MTITCSSATPVKWSHKNWLPWKKALIRSASSKKYLVLRKVSQRDIGAYYCEGTHENGEPFKVRSWVYIGGKKDKC